jgi:phosphatidate phosphatase APP1
LYRTKPYASQDIILVFDDEKIETQTDAYGAFYVTIPLQLARQRLQQVMLASGEAVRMVEGLYRCDVQEVTADTIVVSDIDDTLMHSFIYKKLRKFRTLMFTAVEKRKAVLPMQSLLHTLEGKGAAFFYLSNSEQNLYPLIYRFLQHNNFPAGPLFLKKLRSLRHVLLNIKFPLRNIHKQQTLKDILALFPDKKFVLVGDNTQHDLPVYLEAAAHSPGNIQRIIIRKVIARKGEEAEVEKRREELKAMGIEFYYGTQVERDEFKV